MHSKTISYYNREKEIFFKSYHGEIYLNDVFDSWNSIIENELKNLYVKKYIIDYRNAQMQFKPNDIKAIAEFLCSKKKEFKGSFLALVVNSPEKVVFPHLILYEKIDFYVHAFDTVEAAISFLSKH